MLSEYVYIFYLVLDISIQILCETIGITVLPHCLLGSLAFLHIGARGHGDATPNIAIQV